MFKKVYQDRLTKLADHLQKGKLGHKKFDFGIWHRNGLDRKRDGFCGSAGCAIGECLVVFPRQWKVGGPTFSWSSDPEDANMYDVVLKGQSIDPMESAGQFFGLEPEEVGHLFIPKDQDTYAYGGKDLDDKATRRQVASNIKIFLKYKLKQNKLEKVGKLEPVVEQNYVCCETCG